jgi:hypothetical protein
MGDADGTRALENAALYAMASTGSDSFSVMIVPFNKAERRPATVSFNKEAYRRAAVSIPGAHETTESLYGPLNARPVQKRTSRRRVADIGDAEMGNAEEPTTKCGHCARVGHEVRTCAWPSNDGIVCGCPLCNSGEHWVDKCHLWSTMGTVEKLEVLTNQRANMPCLATTMDWILFVKEILENNPDLGNGRGFPWTAGFGQRLAGTKNLESCIFSYYNAGNRRDRLPADPATKDFAAFMDMARHHAAAAAAEAPREPGASDSHGDANMPRRVLGRNLM